ncbi:MAG: hypothetical protein KDK37_18275, partial [Leptospiraceae bacterium]|nr:hypothetical protein [Leptospiraceae bacterium]
SGSFSIFEHGSRIIKRYSINPMSPWFAAAKLYVRTATRFANRAESPNVKVRVRKKEKHCIL